MDEIIDDERVYNMELSEKLKIVEERRQAKKKEFDQMQISEIFKSQFLNRTVLLICFRQAKVEKNLKTMPKLVEDFKKRMNEREKAAKAETKVKNDLAEQARDFYGFSVDPNDERLQFMLLQLEEAQKAEEKKARKAAKKLEAHQQLQKLMGIGQTEEQSEQPDPMAAVPEPKDKETDMKLFAKLVSERSKLAKAASKIAEEQAAVQNKTSKKKQKKKTRENISRHTFVNRTAIQFLFDLFQISTIYV